MKQEIILRQIKELLSASPNLISGLANTAALLYESLTELNWVGFYLLHHGRLTVGPFCGKTACIEIPLGCGVCGTAAQTDQILCVPDVHHFPGHIACDSASNSEIVVPIHYNRNVIGVLDIDSIIFSRFQKSERCLLEKVVSEIEQSGLFSKPDYSFN